jgi:hypothetical protein
MLVMQLLLHESDWLPVLYIVDTDHVINGLAVSNFLIPPLGGGHSILRLKPTPYHAVYLWTGIGVLVN